MCTLYPVSPNGNILITITKQEIDIVTIHKSYSDFASFIRISVYLKFYVILSCADLYNQPRNQDTELLHYHKHSPRYSVIVTHTPFSLHPLPPSSWRPATTNLSSISVILSFLRMLYKRNHTVCYLLSLAFLTQYNFRCFYFREYRLMIMVLYLSWDKMIPKCPSSRFT